MNFVLTLNKIHFPPFVSVLGTFDGRGHAKGNFIARMADQTTRRLAVILLSTLFTTSTTRSLLQKSFDS